MRIVQFVMPGSGARLGVAQGGDVADVTSRAPKLTGVYAAAQEAFDRGEKLEALREFLEK